MATERDQHGWIETLIACGMMGEEKGGRRAPSRQSCICPIWPPRIAESDVYADTPWLRVSTVIAIAEE